MIETPNNLAGELLDALEELDRDTAPLGLYSCEELGTKGRPRARLQQEWDRCLRPRLQKLGCQICYAQMGRSGYGAGGGKVARGSAELLLPGGSRATLSLLRTSTIKIRKYGSAYRIDPQVKHDERWSELKLDRAISNLWTAPLEIDLRLLILIAFGADTSAFEKQLSALHGQLVWEQHGVHYDTRAWRDRYGRAMSVRLSCWWCRPTPDSARESA